MNKYLYKFRSITSSVLGSLYHNRIDACWEFRYSNSGDLITPFLLRRYGFTPVHNFPQEADFFSCGSLLEKIPQNFSGFVLGTGFMYPESEKTLEKARVLALRGELTRSKLGASPDTLLGDPGLLVARYMPKRQKKRYVAGVVPHFKDKKDEKLLQFCRKYKTEVLFIDIQKGPLEVLRQVDKCECILSSSLHGLVYADSLDIPNVWVVLSDQVSGKGFKFRDYNSALGKTQESIDMTGEETLSQLMEQACEPPGTQVERVKENLHQAFCRLREELLPS